ncbi:MAG: GAF domain-containing sensor histidine kinase [Elusimicrobiota bacterium]
MIDRRLLEFFWCASSAALTALATIFIMGLKSSRDKNNSGRGDIQVLDDLVETIGGPGSRVESILGSLVAILAKYLEADLVAFMLPDPGGTELVVQPGAYGVKDKEEMFYRVPLDRERSSSVRVYKTGTPFITGDAQNDPEVISSYAKLWDVHSLMVLPLRINERNIGVMRVGSFRKNHFDKRHLDLGRLVAGEAAALVEAAVLTKRLSETAEQLTKANRIKDEFISTVSHEFKTPLTTILGFLTLMLDGEAGQLTTQQEKFTKMSINAAKRLEMLVSDVLDLSRIEAGAKMERKMFSVEKSVRSSVENQSFQSSKKGIALSCEIEPGIPEILGDPRWVSLAVDNLLSNAIKFSGAGGEVKVTAKRKGAEVCVCVSDTGIGVPPDERARIFEKFYRSRASSDLGIPGTGLGLAIVREVAERHGGKAWFESIPQKGSRFYFSLPLPAPGSGQGFAGESSLRFGSETEE